MRVEDGEATTMRRSSLMLWPIRNDRRRQRGTRSGAAVVGNREADPVQRQWQTGKQIRCGGSG
jgi:hypothetical protein